VQSLRPDTEITSGKFSHGISEADATTLLQSDVVDAEQAVGRLVRVPLTQGQFDALTDFCYNLGSGRLASSTLLKVLNAGRYDDAVEQLLLWTHAGGKECSALVKRREAEAALWRRAM
jgi:lysozyme